MCGEYTHLQTDEPDKCLTENLYRSLVPPPIKVLCYAAIVDLFKYLPVSKADPKDLVARQKLQLASWMSLWPIRMEKYRCERFIILALS
jgi:hypothetical protein